MFHVREAAFSPERLQIMLRMMLFRVERANHAATCCTARARAVDVNSFKPWVCLALARAL
eukprot:11210208-Lingulodinium_polyedra.AAC.1